MTAPKPAKISAKGENGPDAPRRRRRWPRRLLIAGVLLLALYTLGGFFGAPAVVRHLIAPRISERLHGALELGPVRCNPFTLSISIEQARVTDESGREAIAVERFEGELRLWRSLTSKGWSFAHARLHRPRVELDIAPDGTINLLTILPERPDEPREPGSGFPRIAVEDLRIERGSIHAHDRRFDTPVEASLDELTFTIDHLDTNPEHDNPHLLTASVGRGASARWEGSTRIDPLTTRGTLRLEGLDLAPFSPYARALAGLELADGRLSLELAYTLAPVTEGRRLTLDLPSVALEALDLRRDGQSLLAADEIELSGLRAELDGGGIALDRLDIRAADLHVRRDARGRLELLALLPHSDLDTTTPETLNPDTPTTQAAQRTDLDTIEDPVRQLATAFRYLAEDLRTGWSVEVGEARLADTTLRLEDLSTPHPVRLVAREIDLRAGPLSGAEGYRTPFRLRSVVEQGGTLEAEGVIDPRTPQADLTLRLDGFALHALAPYLPRPLPGPLRDAELTAATLGLDGTLLAALVDDGPNARWEGVLSLADLRTARPDAPDPIALDALSLDGTLDARVAPDGAQVAATWNGNADADTLHADLALESADARLSLTAFQARGGLELAATRPDALSIRWKGQARVEALDAAHQAHDAQPARANARTLALDGQAEFTRAEPARLRWQGTVEGEGLSAEAPGGTPGPALRGLDAATLRAGGTLALNDPAGLVWEGSADVGGATARGDDPERGALRATLTGAQTQGRLAIAPDTPLRWTGRLDAEGLEAAAGETTEAAFALLRLEEADLSVGPDGPTFSAGLLELDAPRLLADLPAADEPRGERTPLPPARLDRLVLRDGAFTVRDPAIDPPLTLSGTGLELSAEGIDTRGGTPMTVDLASGLADVGRVGLTGRVDPFSDPVFADVEISLADMPLRPFSAAAGPKLGYAIESGRLSLTLPVRVEDGRIDGRLAAELRSFHLGVRVPSETAPDLPLKLGLDLLRERGDIIRANLGVRGDTTDPSFTVGGLIWKLIFNFIGNIATSPFRIIGNLVGAGESTDLSQAAFEPGRAEPTPEGAGNIDLLARALRERPALRLVIVGLTGPEDETALRGTALDERLKAHPRSADPELALAALFAEAFPERAGTLVPVPPGRFDQGLPTPELMREALLETIELEPGALAALAEARAQRAAGLLAEQGGVEPERLTPSGATDAEEHEPGARVEFELIGEG